MPEELLRRWISDSLPSIRQSHEGTLLQYGTGSGTLIFTAPHGAPHTRHGRIKLPENATTPLALLLAERFHCNGLATSGHLNHDPNLDPEHETPLRRRLRSWLRPDHLVIDLHGRGDDHGPDIILGPGPQQNERSRKVADALEHAWGKQGLRVARGAPFAAENPGTITAGTQFLGASGLQIEIAFRLRQPEKSPDASLALLRGFLSALPG